MLLASCGEQGSSASSTRAITYRLIPAQGSFEPTGSVIDFVPPESLVRMPPAPPAPLEGTFEVVPAGPAPPPDLGFAFNITRLDLSGGGYTISGHDGTIETTSQDPQNLLIFTAAVVINGTGVQLAGAGARTTFTNDSPPTFSGVEIRGGYFRLRIFAAPVAAARP